MRRKITPAMRRHQDYLRRKAMAIARTYARRLKRLRNDAVRDVLETCAGTAVPEQWGGVIDTALTEPYLPELVNGLYVTTGMPQAKSTARDLTTSKADGSDILQELWLAAIEAYARERAGLMIASLTGTLKDTLIGILSDILVQGGYEGVEKLTQEVYKRYTSQAEWQVRRIIQTETMFSLGEASHVAAESLEIGYVKQWACSGLTNSRETHLAVDGTIVGKDEPFRVGNSLLMYPHDTSLRADAGELINCACSCIRIPD